MREDDAYSLCIIQTCAGDYSGSIGSSDITRQYALQATSQADWCLFMRSIDHCWSCRHSLRVPGISLERKAPSGLTLDPMRIFLVARSNIARLHFSPRTAAVNNSTSWGVSGVFIMALSCPHCALSDSVLGPYGCGMTQLVRNGESITHTFGAGFGGGGGILAIPVARGALGELATLGLSFLWALSFQFLQCADSVGTSTSRSVKPSFNIVYVMFGRWWSG